MAVVPEMEHQAKYRQQNDNFGARHVDYVVVAVEGHLMDLANNLENHLEGEDRGPFKKENKPYVKLMVQYSLK